MIRLQSNGEFLKQKNDQFPLCDQSTDLVDKLPKNQDKNIVITQGCKGLNSKNSVNKSKKM